MTPAELRRAFAVVDTERLCLREPVRGDLDALFAIHGDPETYRFHPAGRTPSREVAAEQLNRWMSEWRERGVGFWTVRVAERPDVIGFGGLIRLTFHGRPVLNTYYRFAPRAWGHGYATEMARAAHTLAARLLPELPLIVRTRPGNLGAQGVAVKLGLIRRPELDDELMTYVSRWE